MTHDIDIVLALHISDIEKIFGYLIHKNSIVLR
jgi:hypothetical protein